MAQGLAWLWTVVRQDFCWLRRIFRNISTEESRGRAGIQRKEMRVIRLKLCPAYLREGQPEHRLQ